MNVGIIGTGNMGKILIDAFMESRVLMPSDLFITNRTLEKAYAIQRQYPAISVEDHIFEVIQKADLIFLCVKPLEIYPILKEHTDYFTEQKCLVSITSPISVEQLETVVHCQVARVIPSITNQALSGVSLLTFGENCNEEWRRTIEELFGSISTPTFIEESITRIASDIVSCGPAFMSYLLQRFIQAATTKTPITEEHATKLATGMLVGMGKLFEKELFTLPTLQEKVCVKGGITGEGIKVLERELEGIFEQLVTATHLKFEEDVHEVQKQFNQHEV
ncbi:late competence protein ComER [Priestia taiwanensis]|uniref:Pyrroline-5-carboxylate reductase n=1 Tax=Priestia taiwanensis TaxID=1347902 RepID=A0A917AU16_9BACI|nr:late competence protein ComER [Priestia taiwanensis]MBM7363719.1 competence protein ComER [Priestia taiwanensis]GGE74701.1 pyrroline-5-carboxylate reductase [Priestia taiwanensis]